ncbi:hypothetical protein EH196_18970 [Bacillus sp. C1-1]|nr:hypothetical protein EH196_18970 [Bacillus sp. C1-1]
MFEHHISNCLRPLTKPSIEGLRQALLKLNATYDELAPYIQSSSEKPYYRKLLFQSKHVELLLMNWSGLDCAPHDHGNSYGWIQVIAGNVSNQLFRVQSNELPELFVEKYYKQGKTFFAPKKSVHRMEGNKGLLTLHLYAPPISGMKVYDLKKCAACVVSDDCGAWWPEDQKQRLKVIQLNEAPE